MNIKLVFVVASFTLLILVFEKSMAQSPDWLWANKIGGSSSDKGQAIATDAFGNVYTTGSFKGQVDFDPGLAVNYITSGGDLDIFISKLDASGNYLWAKAFEGINTDEGLSITVDASGNIYTTGYFQGTVDFDPGPGTYNMTSAGVFDVFISKLDGSGNFIWAKRMGGSGIDEGKSIAIDSSGYVYTAGYFSATADFNPDSANSFNLTTAGGKDIFISKLDNQGNFVWAKAMGGTGGDECLDLILDASGNVFISGYFVQTADFDPGAGTVNLTSAGGSDIYISKLDNSGNYVWAKSIGKTNPDWGYSIALDNFGNIYTTGYYSGIVDFDPGPGYFDLTSTGSNSIFISKLDSSGNFVWAKSMGGNGFATAYSIAIDIAGSGDVYTTGYFSTTVDFDPGSGIVNITSNGNDDIFISKLDSSGNFVWAKAIGGTNADYGQSLAISSTGKIYLTGWFSSASISFGTFSVANTVTTGFPEILIAKLDNLINGIEPSVNGNRVSVYPNPARDQLIIELNGMHRNLEISLYDLTGKIIPVRIDNSAENTYRVGNNVLDQSPGIYLMQIKTDDFIETKRIAIIK